MKKGFVIKAFMLIFLIASIYELFFNMTPDYPFHWSMILFLIPLVHRFAWDRSVEKKGRSVDHKPHTMVTGAVMLVISFITWHWGPARYFAQPLLLQIGIFAAFFDYGMNLLTPGRSWYYMNPNGTGAITDNLWNMCGVWGTLFAKSWIVLVSLGIYFYFSLLK